MLTLGAIPISLPVVQAALSGYSDWPMRALAREMGAPYTIAEVVIDAFVNNLKERARTRHHLLVTDDDHPVGAQLMGSDPDSFPAAAMRLAHAGFDVIDINFGCPAKKASGRCRGGYHLGQPETAIRILQLVRDAVPPQIPVTVKMRRGIDDSEKSRDQFFQILAEAFQIGIAAATIHGRTVEQKYVGPSRWEFLKTVRAEFPNATLLGSGDLFTATDCVRMLKETGVNGVTAARGAIGNPWIFQQAAALLRGEQLPKAPDLHQQRDLMQRHLELAEFALPAEQFLRQVRKFCIFYSAWHPEHLKVRQAFASVTTSEEWSRVLAHWYSKNQPGCFPENPGNLNAGSRGTIDDETNASGE